MRLDLCESCWMLFDVVCVQPDQNSFCPFPSFPLGAPQFPMSDAPTIQQPQRRMMVLKTGFNGDEVNRMLKDAPNPLQKQHFRRQELFHLLLWMEWTV